MLAFTSKFFAVMMVSCNGSRREDQLVVPASLSFDDLSDFQDTAWQNYFQEQMATLSAQLREAVSTDVQDQNATNSPRRLTEGQRLYQCHEIKSGEIKNLENQHYGSQRHRCLDIAGTDGVGTVAMRACDGNLDQQLVLCVETSSDHDCPWARSTGRLYVMGCNDGSECTVGCPNGRENCQESDRTWDCCANHGGRAICPLKEPVMCNEKSCGGADHCCVSTVSRCATMGGPRPCASCGISEQDWVLGCMDGSSCNVTDAGWGCCFSHGGRAECPLNHPFMCKDETCHGDHCCERTCDNHGGVHTCQNFDGQAQDYYSVTIRNRQNGYALEVSGSNVRSNPYTPGLVSQHWYFDNPVRFLWMGVTQEAMRIRNRRTHTCMESDRNTAKIKSLPCTRGNDHDQVFFTYDRGEVLGHGMLVNSKSRKCLDVTGYTGKGNMYTYTCDGRLDQAWTMYSTGELHNAKSNLCVRPGATSGTCTLDTTQRWQVVPYSPADFMLISYEQQCLDGGGLDGAGRAKTSTCVYMDHQVWRWEPPTSWHPKVFWKSAACHNELFIHEVTLGISETIESSRSMTMEVGASITAGIEVGVDFGAVCKFSLSATLSSSLSRSLSRTFSSTLSKSETFSKTCPSGCLWHLVVVGGNTLQGSFKWGSPFTYCSAEEPQCQPLLASAANYCYT